MKIDYEIKNGKIIFNKEGVYFSVPVEHIDKFISLANMARTQYLRNETREETEAYYLMADDRFYKAMNYVEEVEKELEARRQKENDDQLEWLEALENYNERN